jgi:hypothetical protein
MRIRLLMAALGRLLVGMRAVLIYGATRRYVQGHLAIVAMPGPFHKHDFVNRNVDRIIGTQFAPLKLHQFLPLCLRLGAESDAEAANRWPL